MASSSIQNLCQNLGDLTVTNDLFASTKEDFLQKYNSISEVGKPNLNDFILYKELGKGAFATVYFAVNVLTKTKPFAMKVLNKEKIIKDQQLDHVKSEKRLLKSLSSNFIITLHYHFQDETNLYLALEYVPGGELFQFIRSRLFFGEETAKFYSMQMILAIEYLHNLGIIYRDIKPENILITSKGYLKLADFGFAMLMLDSRTYTLCGTPEYLAPEVILNRGYGLSVDWWSIGILIYELLGGHTPFYQSNVRHIYEKIILCKYKFPIHFSSNAKSLIKKLLEPDLTKRLGNLRNKSEDVRNHKWFLINNSSSWSRVENQSQVLPKEIALHKIPPNPKLRSSDISFLEIQNDESDSSKEMFLDF